MTISSQVRTAGPFIGNGVATGGSFAFKVFSVTDLIGVETSDLGVDRNLVYGTDFNVSLNADQNASPGGTINYLIAGVGPSLIPTNYQLNFTSAVANLQPVALTNAGGFFPKVINDALDRLTILVQQLVRGVNASIKFPLSDGTSISRELPNKAARLGKVQAFDPVTGAPVVSTQTLAQIEAGSTSAAASAAAAAVSAAAALSSQNAASTSATNAANSAASINYRFCGTAGGTANALTLTPGTALGSYTGALLEFIVNTANTAEAVTADVSGLGVKNLKQNFKGTKVDLAIGMLQAGMNVLLQYDGTDLVVVNAPWDAQATDIASASTVALASVTGNFANLTGTTTVTAITGLTKGRRMLLRHTGAHILTHSATLFLLNGAANITTAAGDFSEWVTDGTNVYMTRYHRANGKPINFAIPTQTVLTSGSGTYNSPAGAQYLKVRLVGGGGGGAGSGTAGAGAGGTGGTTTFSTYSGVGGAGGSATVAGAGGGAGGGAAYSVGSSGGMGVGQNIYAVNGGHGGGSLFAGGAAGGAGGAGASATANTGGGGGGAGGGSTFNSGAGGGGGGGMEFIIAAGSYSYAVGAGGTAGGAGTSGFAGGVGGSGIIIIEEYYQ